MLEEKLNEKEQKIKEQEIKERLIRDAVINNILTDKDCRGYVERLVASALNMNNVSLELLSVRANTNVRVKDSRLDALFENNEIIVNIEVNTTKSEIVKTKNMRYVCHLLIKDILPNEKDKIEKNIYQINLNYYDIFDKNEFIYESKIIEIKYHILRDDYLKIIDINLEKLSHISYNEIKEKEKNSLERLLYIFVCEDNNEINKIYKRDKEIIEVRNKMTELTQEFLEGLVYDKKAFDERVAYDIGSQEGIKIGEKNRNIEIAKSMLKKDYSIKEITNITGLSLEDINKIAKELKKLEK